MPVTNWFHSKLKDLILYPDQDPRNTFSLRSSGSFVGEKEVGEKDIHSYL